MKRRPRKLLDQARDATRLRHYSIRTENAYVGWIKRYILFHDKRHPREMGSGALKAAEDPGLQILARHVLPVGRCGTGTDKLGEIVFHSVSYSNASERARSATNAAAL